MSNTLKSYSPPRKISGAIHAGVPTADDITCSAPARFHLLNAKSQSFMVRSRLYRTYTRQHMREQTQRPILAVIKITFSECHEQIGQNGYIWRFEVAMADPVLVQERDACGNTVHNFQLLAFAQLWRNRRLGPPQQLVE